MARRRSRLRGNLVAQRLNSLIEELGSRDLLLARLHLLAQADQRFEALAEMDVSALSKIRYGRRICADVELVAIAIAGQVSIMWLLGLSDQRSPEAPVMELNQAQQ